MNGSWRWLAAAGFVVWAYFSVERFKRLEQEYDRLELRLNGLYDEQRTFERRLDAAESLIPGGHRVQE